MNNEFSVDVDTNLTAIVRIPPLATVWFERVQLLRTDSSLTE